MDCRKISERAALCASALLLGACTTTLTLPPSDLPEIAAATQPEPTEWPTVHPVDGEDEKKTLKGTIEEVRIEESGRSYPLYLPMKARLDDDHLLVTGPLGPRAFHLQEVGLLEVTYYDKEKAYKIPGGMLMGFSSPGIVTGLVALGIATTLSPSYAEEVAAIGAVSTAIGLGFLIPGILLVLHDPKPAGAPTTGVRPRLEVGPGGMRFSTTF